jgi:hypothetical protein
MGRILGYGEFILESAGQDQALSSVDYGKCARFPASRPHR